MSPIKQINKSKIKNKIKKLIKPKSMRCHDHKKNKEKKSNLK